MLEYFERKKFALFLPDNLLALESPWKAFQKTFASNRRLLGHEHIFINRYIWIYGQSQVKHRQKLFWIQFLIIIIIVIIITSGTGKQYYNY